MHVPESGKLKELLAKAQKTFDNVPGSKTLPTESQKAFVDRLYDVEVDKKRYMDEYNQKSWTERQLLKVLHTDSGENPWGNIINRERKIIREVQKMLRAASTPAVSVGTAGASGKVSAAKSESTTPAAKDKVSAAKAESTTPVAKDKAPDVKAEKPVATINSPLTMEQQRQMNTSRTEAATRAGAGAVQSTQPAAQPTHIPQFKGRLKKRVRTQPKHEEAKPNTSGALSVPSPVSTRSTANVPNAASAANTPNAPNAAASAASAARTMSAEAISKIAPGSVSGTSSTEERETYTQLAKEAARQATEALVATRNKTVEHKDFQYVLDLQLVLIEEKLLNAKQKEAIDKIRMGHYGFTYLASWVLTPTDEKKVTEEYRKIKEGINARREDILNKYKMETRRREADAIAETKFNKISGISELFGTEKERYLGVLKEVEYLRIKATEDSTREPFLEKEKELLDRINADIYSKVENRNANAFQEELGRIEGLQTIALPVRSALIDELRHLRATQLILMAEIAAGRDKQENGEKLRKTDESIRSFFVKLKFAIDSLKDEAYQRLPEKQKVAWLDEQAVIEKEKTERRLKCEANARQKFNSINGSQTLSESARAEFLQALIAVEERRASYLEEFNKKGIVGRVGDIVFNPSWGNNPWGNIVEVEENINKRVRNAVKDSFLNQTAAEYEQQIAQFVGLHKMDARLREMLEKDLKTALANQKMKAQGITPIAGALSPAMARKKIRIALEFEKIPTFQASKNTKMKNKWIQDTVKQLDALREVRKFIRRTEVELQGDLASDERTRKMEILEEQKKHKEQLIQTLEETVNHIFHYDFEKEDKLFNADQVWVSDYFNRAWDKVLEFVQQDKIQSALAVAFSSGVVGGGIGSAIPFVGTASGVLIGAAVGAYNGYKNPGAKSLLTPFKFLFKEILDISTKPKSYIDRTFRGTVMAGATAATAYGAIALTAAIGLSNPFTSSIIAGIVAVVAVGLVVAGVAKIAKMVSKKLSEKVYGITDSDRYELTPKAKALFGEHAPKIRQFFVDEIRKLQKAIEEPSKDPSPDQVHKKFVLSRRLYELESTWDKIQLGDNDSLKAWEYCSRHLFELKKEAYKAQVDQTVRQHAAQIVNILMDVSKPSSDKPKEKKRDVGGSDSTPMLREEGVSKEKPRHLTFVYDEDKESREVLADIDTLKEIHRVIPKPRSNS